MQKKDNKGSILVWSIFLVLFMSFSFIVTSKQVTSNILKIGLFNSVLEGDSELSIDSEINNFSGGLGQKGTSEFRFNEINSLTGTLSVSSGGPIQYKIIVLSGSIGDTRPPNKLYSSGILDYGTSIDLEFGLDGSYDYGILYLKNLGGFTKYGFKSDYYFYKNDYYFEDTELIGNKVVTKNKKYIKNFTKGYFNSMFGTGEYQSYGLYLDN